MFLAKKSLALLVMICPTLALAGNTAVFEGAIGTNTCDVRVEGLANPTVILPRFP